MDLQLEKRVVLVVGGNGYIGSAIVKQARAEGAIVVVASRTGGSGITMDARNETSIAEGLEQVMQAHKRLDAVVITAAPSAQTLDPTRNGDPAQVADAFDAKSLVFLRIANAVIPIMREKNYGRIVAISGQNALVTGSITGSIRNAALNIAAKNLADELADTGINVVTVNPGIVSEKPSKKVAAGRPGESSPQQIADLVSFLISPLSAVSGESIAIGHRVRGSISF
jgi:NAD(P)-dependent dehydrogenase (short-subunit alcohol dehydrogenase family)